MYDSNLYKKTFTAASGSTNVRKLPSTTSAKVLTLPQGNVLVATGNVLMQKDGKWIQVELLNNQFGYVRSDVVKQITVNGESIAKMLIASDKQVFETLLRCSVYLQKQKEAGKNISKQKAQFQTLYNRLTARQNELKKSSLVSCQSGISKAYDRMTGYLKKLFGISGIGEPVSITIIIGVSLAVGAGISVLVYQLFKPKYDASKTDLKLSADLENALKNVDPATAKKIKDDLEKQIDDAYNQGNSDGTFGSFGSTLKYVGIGILGFIGIRALQNMNTK